MKKFNYQFTIEAPSKELADFIAKIICDENRGVISDVKSSPEFGIENLTEKKPQSEFLPKDKATESTLNGFEEFEKVIHIIKCCIADNTLVDRIAKNLGFKKQVIPSQQ